MDQMYAVVMPSLKSFVRKRLNRESADDVSHEIFLALICFIQSGKIKDFRCLPGIIRTISFRKISEARRVEIRLANTVDLMTIESRIADKRLDQESQAEQSQRLAIAIEALFSLLPHEREILKRYYLEEQSEEEICRVMDLTPTKFRLLKSRALLRFSQMGQRILRRKLRRAA